MPELIAAELLADLPPAELAAAFRPLFEESDWLAGRLAGRRFGTWDEVIAAGDALLQEANDAEKAAILRSHPRLGIPPADLRARSETSWREQGGQRNGAPDVLDQLAAANDRYEARFGFPFVDWVAGRPLQEMVAVIDSQLSSDPAAELSRGCRAIVDIGRDRIKKLEGEH